MKNPPVVPAGGRAEGGLLRRGPRLVVVRPAFLLEPLPQPIEHAAQPLKLLYELLAKLIEPWNMVVRDCCVAANRKGQPFGVVFDIATAPPQGRARRHRP